MKIFRPMNLLIEMGDWLSKSQFKLGHLSYIGASRELWFKFDIASMILENWERVLKVPWNKFDLWVEKSKIDVLVARETDKPVNGNGIEWKTAGIMEFKTEAYPLTKNQGSKFAPVKRLVKNIETDFSKRKENFKFREMIAVTLCHHRVDEDKENLKASDLIEIIEGNLEKVVDEMGTAGFKLPGKSKKMPYIRSSFRGELYGFYSCGVWLKKEEE